MARVVGVRVQTCKRNSRVARDSGAIAECQDWPSLGYPGLVWLFGALMPDQTILW